MTTIASVTDVRTAGALLNAASQGGADDSQINAALLLAQQHLIDLLGNKSAYIAIRDYQVAEAKKQAFKTGEALFAMSFLPMVLTGAQLEQTGYKTQSTIGRATTTFGNPVDVSQVADFWAAEGLKVISDYLDFGYVDTRFGKDDPQYKTGIDAGPTTMIAI